MYLFKKNKKGLSIAEVLVVVVILAILVAVAFSILSGSRNKAKDFKRVTEVSDIGKALGLYYIDMGEYPEMITVGEAIVNPDTGYVYLAEVPTASTTEDVLDCLFVGYEYTRTEGGGSYTIDYCLGEEVDGVGPGAMTYTPESLEDCEIDCIDRICGNNNCGGVCGACSEGDFCSSEFNCIDSYGNIAKVEMNGLYWSTSNQVESYQWKTDTTAGVPVWNSLTGIYTYPDGETSDNYPAFKYCEDLGGDSAWRLPTKDELVAILRGEVDNCTGAAPYSDLSGISPFAYWSSNDYEGGNPASAWGVSVEWCRIDLLDQTTVNGSYKTVCVHD